MPRPTLYYVRHGLTDWNIEGRLQGGHDIPLNDRGRGHSLVVEALGRQVQGLGKKTLVAQEAQGRGELQRLVTQLIQRHQQHRPGLAEGGGHRCPYFWGGGL